MENGENIKLVEPDVLQYTNFRVYLRDYYEFKKKTLPAFSLRYFAEKAARKKYFVRALCLPRPISLCRKSP